MSDTKWSALPELAPEDASADDRVVGLDGVVAVQVPLGTFGRLVGKFGGVLSNRLETVDPPVVLIPAVVTVGVNAWDEDNSFYGAYASVIGAEVMAGDMPGDSYVYLYGGDVTINAGPVSLAGSKEKAYAYAGTLFLRGGTSFATGTPGTAAGLYGGAARLEGGWGYLLDGSTFNEGGSVHANGGSYAASGGVTINGGQAFDGVGGDILVSGGGGVSGGDVRIAPGSGGIPANHGAVVIDKVGGTVIVVDSDGLGFHGNPGTGPVTIGNPAGGGTIDAECRTALVSLLDYLRLRGDLDG